MSVLVHRQHIKKSHSLWSECDFLCLVSKNLYNHCLYNIRQYAFLSDEHNFTVDNNIKIYRTQQQKLKTEFQRNLKNQGLNPKTPFVFANPFVLGEVTKTNRKTGNTYSKKRYAFDSTELCSHSKNLTDDFGNVVKHNAYKGKRITRGLFQTQYGRLVNADVNAAGNQIRKVAENGVYVCCWRRRDLCHGLRRNNIQSTPDSVEAVAVTPTRVVISA